MISKEERKTIVETLAAELRGAERVNKLDLFSRVQLSGREAELALWEARELVRRTDGIVFGVLKDFPAHLERIGGKRLMSHAERQNRAGKRKQQRAGDKFRLVAETSDNDADRERASRAEARVAAALTRKRAALSP